MDIRQKYIDRLKDICRLFEVSWDSDPTIYETSNIDAYIKAVDELRFITGKAPRNTYLEDIEAMKQALPF